MEQNTTSRNRSRMYGQLIFVEDAKVIQQEMKIFSQMILEKLNV